MQGRRAIALAAGPALVLAASTAGAEPVRIRYGSEPGCPSESAFESLVRGHTARAEFASGAARSFEVVLERQGPRWGGTLRVRTAGESRASVRYLEGDSCDEVAAGLALVAALAIDPNASTAPGAAAPSAAPPGPSAPSPSPSASAAPENPPAASPTSAPPPAPPVEPPPPTDRPARPPPGRAAVAKPLEPAHEPPQQPPHQPNSWLVFLGAGIESTAAVAPTPLLGAAAFAEIDARRGPASPSLRLTIAFASSSPFAGPSPVADYFLGVARISACPVGFAFSANLGALPCVEAGAGLVHAYGVPSAIAPEPKDVGWADVGAAAVLRWAPTERMFVDTAGGVLVAITRPTFVFEMPHANLQTVPLVSPMASLSVGARFW